MTIVTTFNRDGWAHYASACLPSWQAHLPPTCEVWVYDEDLLCSEPTVDYAQFPRWTAINPFRHNVYMDFMLRHAATPRRDFRHDARRFAHKIFALGDAAHRCQTDYLVWIDADVFCFEDVPDSFFPSLFMERDLFYLGRTQYTHSECGCWGMRTASAAFPAFFLDFQAIYATDAVFDLPEQHDSWVFDWLRKRYESEGRLISHNLTPTVPSGHVWLASPLAAYFDHWKGRRWRTQKSWREDESSLTAHQVRLDLRHPYWRHLPSRSEAG